MNMPSNWLELAKKYAQSDTKEDATQPTTRARIEVKQIKRQQRSIAADAILNEHAQTTESSPVLTNDNAKLSSKSDVRRVFNIAELPRVAHSVDRAFAIRVLDSIRLAIGGLPQTRGGAQQLAESLNVDKVLISRVLAALREPDPAIGLVKLPGPVPLRRLIERAANINSRNITTLALTFVAEFEAYLKSVKKDRASLETDIRGNNPGLALSRKQAAFKALSQILGCGAECLYMLVIIHKNSVEVTQCLHGVKRLRHGVAPFALATETDGCKVNSELTTGAIVENDLVMITDNAAEVVYGPATKNLDVTIDPQILTSDKNDNTLTHSVAECSVPLPAAGAVIEVLLPGADNLQAVTRLAASLRLHTYVPGPGGTLRQLDLCEEFQSGEYKELVKDKHILESARLRASQTPSLVPKALAECTYIARAIVRYPVTNAVIKTVLTQ